jgi:hypothetical protein
MPQLTIVVDGAEAISFAAAPTIAFRLRVTHPQPAEEIENIALRCQIMIEAQRRHYTSAERAGLRDLFGEADRWSQTLRPILWTHAAVTVPRFSGSVAVQMPVACTFDFNVAAAKYFYAIEADDIPLVFQFSGTLFYSAPDGSMQIAQIGWDKDARFRMPAAVWREMMDLYYPNSAWLRLSRDVFDRLHDYKQRSGLATWEQALDSLLSAATKSIETKAGAAS